MKSKLINEALNQQQHWILDQFTSFVDKGFSCRC
jgi:hypothetical protein